MDMLLVCDRISGRRAYEVGLVGHVVPDGQALAKARELAGRLAANGPLAGRNITAAAFPSDGLSGEQPCARVMDLATDGSDETRACQARATLHRSRWPSYHKTKNLLNTYISDKNIKYF